MRWIERHQIWIGFSFAFAAGAMTATFWMYREAGNFWDVMTAIGTVAAVVVALGVASWSDIQRRRDSVQASHVVAARIAPGIEYFAAQLQGTATTLTFWADTDVSFSTLKRHFRDCGSFEPSDEQLRALVPLKNQCAFRIARGFGIFHMLLQLCESRISLVGGSDISRASQEDMKSLSCMARQAANLLEVAARECAAVANISASVPGSSELYEPYSDLGP